MEKTISKRELKKIQTDVLKMGDEILQIESNNKYLHHYFYKYLQSEYDGLKEASTSLLEYFCALYKNEKIPISLKEKIFNVGGELIFHYGTILYHDKEYMEFIERIGVEFQVSLKLKFLIKEKDFYNVYFSPLIPDIEDAFNETPDFSYFNEFIEALTFPLGPPITTQERAFLNDIMHKIDFSPVGYTLKYSFWYYFIQLRKRLDEMLNSNPGEKDYYIKNRKRYITNVEKYYLSYNYIGLMKIYQKIVYEKLCNAECTPDKKYVINQRLMEIDGFMNAFQNFSTPPCPFLLSLHTITNRQNLKERLKAERDKIGTEYFSTCLYNLSHTDPEHFQQMVSCIELSENGLMNKTFFTLYSALKIIG